MGLGRPVKRLFDLEIDEVSLVDRPANQFGKVAFSKRAEDDMPELFDADGQPVDEGDLEHGDAVFDADGNELVYIQEGTPEYDALADDVESAFDDVDDDLEPEDELEDERELAAVGKRGQRVRKSLAASRRQPVRKSGRRSFGETVYEELSKALTQRDRDEVLSRVFDVIDEMTERNERLEGVVGKMADDRAIEQFSALAGEYGPLPVHPTRLGAIMKRASETLPREDVEILDRLFTSVGEQLYSEVGKSGTGASVEVTDAVDALVDEIISKGADMTREQAVTAVYTENPAAYDEYLAETGQLRNYV